MSLTTLILLLIAGGLAFVFVQTLQQNKMQINSDPKNSNNMIKDAQNAIDEEFATIMLRVDAAFAENRMHDAEAGLENALKLQPHNEEALAKYAYLFVEQKEYEAAYGIYLKALGLHANSASLYGAKASLLAKMKRYDEAKESFIRSIELNPKNPITYYNFANMLVSLDEIEAAKEGYLQAIELNKDFKEAKEALSKLSMKKLA